MSEKKNFRLLVDAGIEPAIPRVHDSHLCKLKTSLVEG